MILIVTRQNRQLQGPKSRDKTIRCKNDENNFLFFSFFVRNFILFAVKNQLLYSIRFIKLSYKIFFFTSIEANFRVFRVKNIYFFKSIDSQMLNDLYINKYISIYFFLFFLS